MSITITKNKAVHPNKLVSKHEEFIVNKSLANKVRSVKSTIDSGNRYYEQVLNTRKKREHQKSTHLLPIHMEDLPEEHRQYLTKQFRIKTSDARPQKYQQMEGFSPAIERKIHTSDPNHNDGFYGSPASNIIQNKSQSTKHNNIGNFGAILPQYTTTIGVHKSQPVENILGAKRESDLLIGQLIEKKIEMELFKNELTDWWHEDYKTTNNIQPFRNLGSARTPNSNETYEYETSNLKVIKSLKKIHSLQKDLGSKAFEFPITEKPRKKILSQKNSEKDLTNPKVNFSNQRPSLNIHQPDKSERPSTVNMPKSRNNDNFKLRFSNNLDSVSGRNNKRYDIDEEIEYNDNYEIDRITEKEETTSSELVRLGKSTSDVKSSLKDEIPHLSPPSFSKGNSNKFENVPEEIEKQNSSPQIYPTSKTLAIQGRTSIIEKPKPSTFESSEEIYNYQNEQYKGISFNPQKYEIDASK